MASPSDLADLERHIPSLRRYAAALAHELGDADDLVQDCLERALAKLDGRRGGAMRPWLFSILHNVSINRWRRWRRSGLRGDPVPELPVPPAQQASAELRAALRGLDRLPPEQRQVLLLVAVEGFDYAEAAAILAIPVGTVMSRLSRARDRLREVMEPQRPHLRRVK